jgi:hypothetical protein
MDWESDPELKAMRDEFVASLAGRRKLLDGGAVALQFTAHKLAGVAESYGFPTLTRVGEAIDDWIDHVGGPAAAAASPLLERAGKLLDEALSEASRAGRDPERFGSDPRLAELTSAGGSPLSAARPGSSGDRPRGRRRR